MGPPCRRTVFCIPYNTSTNSSRYLYSVPYHNLHLSYENAPVLTRTGRGEPAGSLLERALETVHQLSTPRDTLGLHLGRGTHLHGGYGILTDTLPGKIRYGIP